MGLNRTFAEPGIAVLPRMSINITDTGMLRVLAVAFYNVAAWDPLLYCVARCTASPFVDGYCRFNIVENPVARGRLSMCFIAQTLISAHRCFNSRSRRVRIAR